MFGSVYFLFELMAFVISVIQYTKMKGTPYRYFVPYLLFIVFYEFGTIQKWFSINHRNLHATNISTYISFLFCAFFLRGLLRNPYFKKRMAAAIVITVACSLINMAFFQGFWNLDSFTILMQFMVIIVLCGIYFYELLHYTIQPLALIRLPAFWVNTGFLFFCVLNFMVYASFAYMAYKGNYTYFLLFNGIASISIAVLYTCLSLAFLCFSKPARLPEKG